MLVRDTSSFIRGFISNENSRHGTPLIQISCNKTSYILMVNCPTVAPGVTDLQVFDDKVYSRFRRLLRRLVLSEQHRTGKYKADMGYRPGPTSSPYICEVFLSTCIGLNEGIESALVRFAMAFFHTVEGTGSVFIHGRFSIRCDETCTLIAMINCA